LSIKKIVASAGLAAGALAAMSSTAHAVEIDPIDKVSEIAGSAGISTLHNTGGGVDATYVPREGSDLLP
jgi:hypothetical protein